MYIAAVQRRKRRQFLDGLGASRRALSERRWRGLASAGMGIGERLWHNRAAETPEAKNGGAPQRTSGVSRRYRQKRRETARLRCFNQGECASAVLRYRPQSYLRYSGSEPGQVWIVYARN